MNANANLPVRPALGHLFVSQVRNQLLNLQRGQYTINRMRAVLQGYSANSHVSVTDGLDLFQLVLSGDLIELTKATVEFLDQFLGRETLRDLSEPDEIGKQNGRAFVIDRLYSICLLQFLCDRLRQNVAQQQVRFSPLLIEVLR